MTRRRESKMANGSGTIHRLAHLLILHLLRPSVSRLRTSSGCSEEQIAEYRRSIRTEFVDLNADNVFELFIYIENREFCGSGFNCSFWIFQRQRSRYRLLLKDYPVVRLGTDITMGFKDLESQGRMGSCLLSDGTIGREVYLTVFKWDGNEYKPQLVGEKCRPLSTN